MLLRNRKIEKKAEKGLDSYGNILAVLHNNNQTKEITMELNLNLTPSEKEVLLDCIFTSEIRLERIEGQISEETRQWKLAAIETLRYKIKANRLDCKYPFEQNQ